MSGKWFFNNKNKLVCKIQGYNELFNKNLGSEDYIAIADISDFIFIINLPKFDKNNSNQQQRFITFIDIIYEKRIPLMITSEENLEFLGLK